MEVFPAYLLPEDLLWEVFRRLTFRSQYAFSRTFSRIWRLCRTKFWSVSLQKLAPQLKLPSVYSEPYFNYLLGLFRVVDDCRKGLYLQAPHGIGQENDGMKNYFSICSYLEYPVLLPISLRSLLEEITAQRDQLSFRLARVLRGQFPTKFKILTLEKMPEKFMITVQRVENSQKYRSEPKLKASWFSNLLLFEQEQTLCFLDLGYDGSFKASFSPLNKTLINRSAIGCAFGQFCDSRGLTELAADWLFGISNFNLERVQKKINSKGSEITVVLRHELLEEQRRIMECWITEEFLNLIGPTLPSKRG